MNLRKYGSWIFIAVIAIFVGWFAFSQIIMKVNQSKNAKLIQGASSGESFKNTAEKVTLTASEAPSAGKQIQFTVGKDVKAGYYDILTKDSTVQIGKNMMAISPNNLTLNIPVLNGDQVVFMDKGTVTLTPSKLEKLKKVPYQGGEAYQVLAQGDYFVGTQIPKGKYQLFYENLPAFPENNATANNLVVPDVSKLPDIRITMSNLSYSQINPFTPEFSGLPDGDVNGTYMGKQQNPIIDLNKAKILVVQYNNPPANLKVYLKVVE